MIPVHNLKNESNKRNRLHKVHSYLLRDLKITHSNQAWTVGITYLRMQNEFMYLIALIDVHSRYVVGWELSNTLETDFCMNALKTGLIIVKPEIVENTMGISGEWKTISSQHR